MKLDFDIATHPAFAPYIKPPSGAGFDFRKLFEDIDTIANEIYSTKSPLPTLAERYAAFDHKVRPLRKSFEQALAADSTVETAIVPMLKQRFCVAIKELATEREAMSERLRPVEGISAKARADAEEMDAVGFKTWHLPERWLKPLKDFLAEDLAHLRSRMDGGAGELLLKDAGALPQAILKDFCEKEGVLDTLSALYGRRFSKMGFTLHVSHPGDRWYRVFDDIGHPLARTAQMHYDLAYDVPKAMVYLNDVSEEQGPFSLIPESHHWQDLGMWLSFRKQVTLVMGDYLKEINAPALGNNASRFQRIEARKALASLPTGIRSTAHPGDLILDDHPLSESLVKAEKRLTGSAGWMGVFTGGHVLHRGGIATKGERWALQVCFWPEEEVKMPTKQALQAAGLVADKKGTQKKSFFSLWFGGGKDVKKKNDAPVKLTITTAEQTSEQAPVAAYSAKRFGLGLRQILGEDSRLTLVDIGGALNLQPHWNRFHQAASFYIYEPHRQSYEDLVARQKREKYFAPFHYLNEALAGRSGKRTLYMSHAPTGTSLLPPKKGGLSDFPHNTYLYPMVEEEIETTTLRESLQRAGVTCVNGIKLDTQGTEIEILQSLGDRLSAGLLFVEMEIGVIEHYAEPSACLEVAIPLLRSMGLDLYDLRTNRFHGNVARLPGGVKQFTDMLGCHKSTPAVSQRLNEVDAIFFRDPRLLIDQGTDEPTLRRLIACLCGYGFYGEAVFAASYGVEREVLDRDTAEQIIATIRQLHHETRLEIGDLEERLAAQNYQTWGQYMLVPYPSA